MELTTNPYFKKTMKYVQILSLLLCISVILLFFVILGTYTVAKIAGPPPFEIPQSTIYYSADGTVIGETNSGEKRYWINLEDISPHLVDATLAIEDQRFYSHIGFDLKRILGAIVADIKALAKVQGASTISQQYARNLFLSPEKTWTRKMKEAFYTIRLEANYSKKEILEGYLNTIYYGHGTYGVEAASLYYFNKNAKELTLSEASLLAGIPKGPTHYSPFNSLEKAKNRQQIILDEMVEQNRITKDEAQVAQNAQIQLAGKEVVKQNHIAPYFQDIVRHELNEIGLDEREIQLGGLRVYTTLDSNLQQLAEEQVDKTFPENSLLQTSFVAMDPNSGDVKVLIGGRNYVESSYNRAVQALRQPGSTIKPFLYYAAIARGFTPVSTFRSEETTFTFDEGRQHYSPANFNHKYAEDDITLLQALALSDNVFAVKTHLYLGMETLADISKQFGIESPLDELPSTALGTSNIRLIELANAYSHFANGGKSVEPVFIRKVTDRNGDVLFEHEQNATQILDPDSIFVVTHMMTGIFDKSLDGYANVTGSNILPKLTRIYAGKSGTTNTDNWMIGFTPKLVTAVWTGYDRGKSLTRSDERQYAKNIWADFMEEALQGEPIQSFKPTDGVVGVNIDPETGLLGTASCGPQRFTYFIKGTEPTEYCSEDLPIEEKEEQENNETPVGDEIPWYKRLFDWT